MGYVDKIVGKFGGVRPMASAIGKPPSTVQSWKARGRIPDDQKEFVWKVAMETEGVDLDAGDFVPFEIGSDAEGDAA